MVDGATVERATVHDLSVVREVRLRALRDAPRAFASTLEREEALSGEEWRSRLDDDWYLAYRDGRPVGIVAAFPDGPDGRERHLASMWVEPAERGTGTATALVDAVVASAKGHGARAVCLWVVDGNLRARRFYERLGFAGTGRRQPVPTDPTVGEERLTRPL